MTRIIIWHLLLFVVKNCVRSSLPCEPFPFKFSLCLSVSLVRKPGWCDFCMRWFYLLKNYSSFHHSQLMAQFPFSTLQYIIHTQFNTSFATSQLTDCQLLNLSTVNYLPSSVYNWFMFCPYPPLNLWLTFHWSWLWSTFIGKPFFLVLDRVPCTVFQITPFISLQDVLV